MHTHGSEGVNKCLNADCTKYTSIQVYVKYMSSTAPYSNEYGD